MEHPDKSFQRSRRWRGQWARADLRPEVGDDFLPDVPAAPGVYRFYGPEDALLYVGKARNLRRRLAQYLTTGRRKKERKRRALVRLAERITWEICESELDTSLAEIRLDDLRAVERFCDDEASRLAAAIAATGFPAYPVPQRDRDLLFLEYRATPGRQTLTS